MFTRIKIWLLLCGFGIPLLLIGQKPYEAQVADSKILIHGTSNIHDWTSWVDNFSAKAQLSIENGSLSSIEALTLRIPVKAIKSGKEAMDDNTYEALKAKSYTNITYRLIRISNMTPVGDQIKINAIGEISIAGVKKQVPLTVLAKITGDNISFSGKANIKMTDYGIEPPTALLGAVSTGDELKIEFVLLMNTQTNFAP